MIEKLRIAWNNEENLKKKINIFEEYVEKKYDEDEYIQIYKIEEIFPKTLEYIKSNIWHCYDAKYRVSMYDDKGIFKPLIYNVVDFTTTFKRYFPICISKWFDSYHRKYSLTKNETRDRTYKVGNVYFLNLSTQKKEEIEIEEFKEEKTLNDDELVFDDLEIEF
jgi:hypothetical protein